MRPVRALLVAAVMAVPAFARAQHAAPVVVATTGNPHGPNLKEPCTSCHRPDGWTPVRISKAFKHAPKTFPLAGAHASATCASCHRSAEFTSSPATCVGCHQDVHRGEVGTDCARCHTSRAFVDRSAMTRMHQLTRFPLRAAHAVVACESCHLPVRSGQLQFVRTNTTCASCHASTFRATASPPHVEPSFSMNCTACHGTASWKGAQFDHSLTLFPLTGGHRTATCAQCHADRQYHGRSMECQSCHQQDYAAAKNPPHSQGFPTTCASCHTTAKWGDARFDHDQATTFALTGAHRTATCADCHADRVFRGKSQACVSCHQSSYDRTTAPKHAAAGFGTTCSQCHTTARWEGAPFDHTTATRYPLTGAHRAVTCAQCHGDDVYRGKATTCASCHQATYAATTTPPHAAAGFSTGCETCHTTAMWKGATFNHAVTKFPLTGAHQPLTCAQCHADNVYRGKPTTCVSCHQAAFNATTNPSHRGYPTTCEGCHGTTRWTGATFDHARTLFALTGAHRTATCAACHGDGVYKGKPTTCVSCHQSDYDGSATPNHRASGFSTTCETCHTTTQWDGAVFDHGRTLFALTGAHRTATCADCHADGVYKGKPTTCVSCHQADFDGSTTPNHRSSGFSTTCETCHTTTQWAGAVFDHGRTLFPLTGAHRTATCTDCHADGVYKGKPTTCVSCHTTDYSASTNPHHAAAGFMTQCESCHGTSQWDGGTFNHGTTSFPLTGAHIPQQCIACHASKVYDGLPATCVSCHLTAYNATTRPDHPVSAFPTACEACHTTTQWLGAVFDHGATQFPLTGAHRATPCLDCHADGVYDGKPVACASCHQGDYNGTTNPPHGAAGFSMLCQSCHTTTQWPGATFNHSATRFPLTGAHGAATCLDCHGDGVYKGKPTTCVTCHNTDYSASTNPHHAAAGFVTQCETCHGTSQWQGGTYDHNATSFPLTGAHVPQQCIACHASKVYDGLPSTCVSCHLPDYTGTTNPNHQAAMFPTTCQSCHTTVRWLGATFNHDGSWFPIYSGKHKGRWTRCSDCHVNASNFQVFECITCHEHSDKTKVDADHKGKTGYSYQSIKCYACHPKGD